MDGLGPDVMKTLVNDQTLGRNANVRESRRRLQQLQSQPNLPDEAQRLIQHALAKDGRGPGQSGVRNSGKVHQRLLQKTRDQKFMEDNKLIDLRAPDSEDQLARALAKAHQEGRHNREAEGTSKRLDGSPRQGDHSIAQRIEDERKAAEKNKGPEEVKRQQEAEAQQAKKAAHKKEKKRRYKQRVKERKQAGSEQEPRPPAPLPDHPRGDPQLQHVQQQKQQQHDRDQRGLSPQQGAHPQVHGPLPPVEHAALGDSTHSIKSFHSKQSEKGDESVVFRDPAYQH